MLDLSTAVTIESPFVPYSPDSCSIIPRDISDVYQLVTGDHIVVRWHKPVKGERDEDVMWVALNIKCIQEWWAGIKKCGVQYLAIKTNNVLVSTTSQRKCHC